MAIDPSGAAPATSAVAWTPAHLLRILRANARFIAVVALVSGATVGGVTALTKRTYTSGASFVLQSTRQSGAGMSGLASQLGISVGGGDVWSQPTLYVDLAQSRRILEAIAADTICDPCAPAGHRGPYYRLQDFDPGDSAHRMDDAVRQLRKDVGASLNQRTGVVTLTASSPKPWVAQQVTQRLLTSLSQFNLASKRSQASAERTFAEQRLDAVSGELRAAEGRLQEFYRTNRSYENSPDLRFEEGRLQREVSVKHEIYSVLARTVEQARMEEVRDLPVLTVIDPASYPLEPNPRGLLIRILFGALIGALIAGGVTVAQAWRRDRRLAFDA